MPVVRIDFDSTKAGEAEVKALATAAQEIVSRVTAIEDVVVYANDSQIKVKVHPIELFVEMSGWKIKNLDELTQNLKSELTAWKQKSSFKHPINLTVTPMPWKIEIGI